MKQKRKKQVKKPLHRTRRKTRSSGYMNYERPDPIKTLIEEVRRIREIQECGGLERYYAVMASRALNSTTL